MNLFFVYARSFFPSWINFRDNELVHLGKSLCFFTPLTYKRSPKKHPGLKTQCYVRYKGEVLLVSMHDKQFGAFLFYLILVSLSM